MKSLRLLPLTLLLLVTACVSFPTSWLADQARARVTPSIEKQLAAQDFNPYSNIYLRGFKEEGTLEIWAQDRRTGTYRPFKSYQICKFSGRLGPKLREGDKQAPEGFYDVTRERLNPNSKHHLSFNIGFPNDFDKAQGRTGSALMVHGGCVSEGCYAMGDEQIEEIYILVERALRNGQERVPVDFFPFRMTAENMVRHAANPSMPFWLYLKRGYDDFEYRNTVQPTPVIQELIVSRDGTEYKSFRISKI